MHTTQDAYIRMMLSTLISVATREGLSCATSSSARASRESPRERKRKPSGGRGGDQPPAHRWAVAGSDLNPGLPACEACAHCRCSPLLLSEKLGVPPSTVLARAGVQ